MVVMAGMQLKLWFRPPRLDLNGFLIPKSPSFCQRDSSRRCLGCDLLQYSPKIMLVQEVAQEVAVPQEHASHHKNQKCHISAVYPQELWNATSKKKF